MPVKVIAHIDVVPEYLKEVLAIQKEAVGITLKEPGCIEYALYQQSDAPEKLTFVETWESPEALKVHSNTSYFIEKGKLLTGKIAAKDVRTYALVE